MGGGNRLNIGAAIRANITATTPTPSAIDVEPSSTHFHTAHFHYHARRMSNYDRFSRSNPGSPPLRRGVAQALHRLFMGCAGEEPFPQLTFVRRWRNRNRRRRRSTQSHPQLEQSPSCLSAASKSDSGQTAITKRQNSKLIQSQLQTNTQSQPQANSRSPSRTQLQARSRSRSQSRSRSRSRSSASTNPTLSPVSEHKDCVLDRQPNNLSVYSDEEDEEDEEDGDDDDDDNYVDNIINNINDNDRDDDSNNYDCDINVGDNMSHQEGATTLTFRRSSSRGLGTEGGGNQLDEYRDTDIDMDDLFEGDEEEGMFEESDWVNVQGDELTGEALQFGYDKEFEAAAALMGVDAAAPRDLSMFAVGQELEAEWRSDAEDHNQRLGRVAGGGADDALDIRRLVDLFLQRTGAVQ